MIFTISDISKILHINNLASGGNAIITSVAIDSRKVTTGSLFVALKGEQTDGRHYVADALKQGAKAIIINDNADGFDLLKHKEIASEHGVALFVVEDSLKVLQLLAKHYLQRFPKLKKIALTGSSGKTTVKNLLYAIFSQCYHTHATMGNYNSETGLPLSVFHIEDHHDITILEMGMNHRGEIADLASIVEPDYAIITNIGQAHIGFLESVEEIAKEKKAIFSRFIGNQVAFIPQNDAYASLLAQDVDGKVLFYAPHTIKRLDNVQSLGLDGWLFTLGSERIHLHLPGRHNFENACLAIYVAKELGIKNIYIKQGLEGVRASEHRHEVIKGAVTVIKDCYNANPESMRVAIEMIKAEKFARKVAFLAEMKELGAKSSQAHKELVDPILEANIQAIFLLGKDMLFLERELKVRGFNGMIFSDNNLDNLEAHLKLYLKAGDLLLIKGSRSHQLERLIPTLVDHHFIPMTQPVAQQIKSK